MLSVINVKLHLGGLVKRSKTPPFHGGAGGSIPPPVTQTVNIWFLPLLSAEGARFNSTHDIAGWRSGSLCGS